MKATLVKRATEDGYVSVNDDVPLGREYDVVTLPGTSTVPFKMADAHHVASDVWHKKLMCYVKEAAG
jgi:hypothetical protein